MSRPVTALRNIGPAMADALAAADIHTVDRLHDIGADDAYAAMLRTGTRPHFIGYYVLVMALQGRPWNDCKGAEKLALRARFDAIKAAHSDDDRAALERFLDDIGVRPAGASDP
ncbi:MAG: TfoX/Sxy family DNA transformation protein [Roseobacter sp.]